MTTLWEKVKAEIVALENGAHATAEAFEAKLKELFEYHASVDMGKTADVVLATLPSVAAVAEAAVVPVEVAKAAQSGECKDYTAAVLPLAGDLPTAGKGTTTQIIDPPKPA